MKQENAKIIRSLHQELNPDPVEDNTNFEFEDVEPDDSLRQEVKNLIHRIYENSPDGSVIKGTLRKVRNGYKGVFKVFHSGGHMIAEGIQRTADETVHLLEKQIWGKIKLWRKDRFRNEPIEGHKIG